MSGSAGCPVAGRLFIALWPDESTRRALDALILRLKPSHPVASQNLHLTLAYLGTTTATIAECLINALEALALQPIPALDLCRLGVWPAPRVLWIAPRTTPSALVRLHDDVWTAAVSCGFTRESRPFSPHITLARKTQEAPALDWVPEIRWPPTTLALVESVSGPAGVCYVPRWSRPLTLGPPPRV